MANLQMVPATVTVSCRPVAQTFRHSWFASFTLMCRLTVRGDFPGDAFALADFSGNPDDSPQLETAWVAWFVFCFGYAEQTGSKTRPTIICFAEFDPQSSPKTCLNIYQAWTTF